MVEITDSKDIVFNLGVLKGMIDVTLKDGNEKTLKENFPEINSVKDITDHTNTDNAYY